MMRPWAWVILALLCAGCEDEQPQKPIKRVEIKVVKVADEQRIERLTAKYRQLRKAGREETDITSWPERARNLEIIGAELERLEPLALQFVKAEEDRKDRLAQLRSQSEEANKILNASP